MYRTGTGYLVGYRVLDDEEVLEYRQQRPAVSNLVEEFEYGGTSAGSRSKLIRVLLYLGTPDAGTWENEEFCKFRGTFEPISAPDIGKNK